jgi:hypothetical protein
VSRDRVVRHDAKGESRHLATARVATQEDERSYAVTVVRPARRVNVDLTQGTLRACKTPKKAAKPAPKKKAK